MVQPIAPDARAVLTEWFGPPERSGTEKAVTWPRTWPDAMAPKWWKKDAGYDAELKARFGALLEDAKRGRLDDWKESALETTALIVLLDQFSRNIHRDTKEAFAADDRALALAREISKREALHALPEYMQCFAGMPFMHAEDREAQREGQAFFRALHARATPEHRERLANNVEFMDRHAAIVERFGRFPHRNEILGRASTPEEIEFLKQPGSSF